MNSSSPHPFENKSEKNNRAVYIIIEKQHFRSRTAGISS